MATNPQQEFEAELAAAAACSRFDRPKRPSYRVVDDDCGFRHCVDPLRPDSVTTLGYRLRAIARGKERTPVDSFPWAKAWAANLASRARATQIGTLAALQGLVSWAGLPAGVLEGIEVSGPVSRGKKQLRIDAGRKFVTAAIEAGDPLAMAAATMAFCGLRPGEVVALVAEDVDDDGRVLWVPGTKTAAAKREIPVDPQFTPYLVAAARGKAPDAVLFDHVPERRRRGHRDANKARKDALLRRVRALCTTAGVAEVVSHSLRGLNATLRRTGGATDASITAALGHLNISTTKRHYFAPGIVEVTEAKKAFGRLLPVKAEPAGNE
jgi:integrase